MKILYNNDIKIQTKLRDLKCANQNYFPGAPYPEDGAAGGAE